MEIGVGLDASLGLSFGEQAELSQEAARLGYTSIWTPEAPGHDAFQLCVQRWAASRQVVPEGIATGIAVSPVMYRTPMALAMSGGTVSSVIGATGSSYQRYGEEDRGQREGATWHETAFR